MTIQILGKYVLAIGHTPKTDNFVSIAHRKHLTLIILLNSAKIALTIMCSIHKLKDALNSSSLH